MGFAITHFNLSATPTTASTALCFSCVSVDDHADVSWKLMRVSDEMSIEFNHTSTKRYK